MTLRGTGNGALTPRRACSCGRDQVELGCDFCRYCRAEYEERQYHREQESVHWAGQAAEYEEWRRAQEGPTS